MGYKQSSRMELQSPCYAMSGKEISLNAYAEYLPSIRLQLKHKNSLWFKQKVQVRECADTVTLHTDYIIHNTYCLK